MNVFNRLTFLAEVITKLQKMHLFRQFKDHNSGSKHENLTNDPIFLSAFFDLTVCNFFSEFESTQNSFSCGPPFGSSWSVKYLNFWPRATDSDSSSHFFLETRHPEVTKNLYYVLSTQRSQIPIFLGSSSWTKFLSPYLCNWKI